MSVTPHIHGARLLQMQQCYKEVLHGVDPTLGLGAASAVARAYVRKDVIPHAARVGVFLWAVRRNERDVN